MSRPELEEETGITLDKEFDSQFNIDYKKNGVSKLMDIFVYYRSKKDIQQYIADGKEWKIDSRFYDTNEIESARLLLPDAIFRSEYLADDIDSMAENAAEKEREFHNERVSE